MKFKDKIVLITGSSRGIGKATALLFAKEGANIVLNYHISEIEPDALDNVKSVMNDTEKSGAETIIIEADVSNEDQVKKMIDETISKFGRIDILVNNAGVVFDVPFKERTVEQWKSTLGINLIGTFLCSKYASRHMPNGGRIVNISSTNGIDSFSTESIDYDASKAGVIILTRNLAKELAPNILVNSVAPGWVNTSMNKNLPKDFVEEETAKIYLKRFAEPEEIAKAVLFFASEDAGYITGSTLKVDGGHG